MLEPFFYVGTDDEGFVEVEKSSVRSLLPLIHWSRHLKGGGCSENSLQLEVQTSVRQRKLLLEAGSSTLV